MKNYFQSKKALGGEVLLNISGNFSLSSVDKIFDDLWLEVVKFENRFSRFIFASELSKFNRNAGVKQRISPEFVDFLMIAKKYSELTGKLYNPFVLPVLQKAGYVKSFLNNVEQLDDYSNSAVVDISMMKIGNDWAFIPYGSAIDLGGCGKGYLADRLSELVEKRGCEDYWFSLGGDIIANGLNPEAETWHIDVQSAKNPEKVVAKIRLPGNKKMGVATSGIIRRRGVHNNTSWHHIIDPITLKPAVTDVKVSTVCADSALEADVFATCCVILGSRKAPGFLEGHGIASSLLQCESSSSKVILKKSGNLIELYG